MPPASFEISSSRDFFQTLKRVEAEYSQDPTSSTKAIITFMFAYHLREWIWQEYEELVRSKLGVKAECQFNAKVNTDFPNFPIIREVCNGSKHCQLDPINPKTDKFVNILVNESGLTGGAFSAGFSSGFDIGRLTIATTNNEVIIVKELLAGVIDYYESLFAELGLEE